MRVEVCPYNPEWPLNFQTIKAELAEALSGVEYLSIEHVGSTSVPALPAKAIIDVDIVITAPHLEATIKALTKDAGYAGYTYMGEWGIPDRHAFRKPNGEPSRNLYVCIDGCQALKNHLAVRDICVREQKVKAEYARVKMGLAEKEWTNVDEYCEAKNEVLYWVLEQAGMTQEMRDQIRKANTSAL